jgi:predicted nucleotidyltransferase
MGTSITIADALFSKTQQRVLALLYGHVERSYYLKEIINWVNAGRGSVQRELEKMTAAGLLTKRTIGNQHHYQANPDCPVYKELLGIVKKTFGVADVIRKALVPFQDNIDWAFIYGSVAKGEESAKSDVDLLVISDSLAFADLMSVLTDAEQSLGRPINPSIYTIEQIKGKLEQKNAFLTRLMEQPKLWVKGSEDDIREIR